MGSCGSIVFDSVPGVLFSRANPLQSCKFIEIDLFLWLIESQ